MRTSLVSRFLLQMAPTPVKKFYDIIVVGGGSGKFALLPLRLPFHFFSSLFSILVDVWGFLTFGLLFKQPRAASL